MSKKDVKKHLLDHSAAKVRLLGEYLKRYLNIITNDGFTKRIKIYDLFCGEGVYENGGEGSPIVALKEVKNVHFINAAKRTVFPKLDCHFNDLDPDKIVKVKQAILDKSLYYPQYGDIEYSSIDYQQFHSQLLTVLTKFKANNEKAFIFIDPYEYKHIKANQIKSLIASGNAEVLLWLPTQFMYRFATNGTPIALKDFITEILPDFEQSKPETVWHFVASLKDGFQAFLGENYFVDTFTIQKDSNTVFCLFFFTSHIKGFEKMLEAKWEIDTEQGKGWNFWGNQHSLFHELRTNPLEEKLKIYLSGTERCNGELYVYILKQGFLPKHANEIFASWQDAGGLTVSTSDGKPARKKSFYIAYNHYKDDFKKVTLKMK